MQRGLQTRILVVIVGTEQVIVVANVGGNGVPVGPFVDSGPDRLLAERSG